VLQLFLTSTKRMNKAKKQNPGSFG